MSNLPDLPLDICREILLRLPGESLFRLRAVCKRWCKVIDDPNFARAHNNIQHSSSSYTLFTKNSSGPHFDSLSTFDLDAVNYDDGDVQTISSSFISLTNHESFRCLPVSTCNGLMLVSSPLEIWNLSTNERLRLPRLDFHSYPRTTFTGLGYDHAAQDYKAVAIQGEQARVYSLRSDTWTKIRDWPSISTVNSWWGPQQNDGVFMCGALHWLSLSDNKIVALDLGTEKHRHIQLHPSQEKVGYKNIDVLGGCLFLSAFTSGSHFDAWVIKDYGSDDESWIKLFSIETKDLRSSVVGECKRPVAYIKDKNQVFLKDGGPGFLLFDVESNSMKRVRIQGLVGCLDAQIIQRSIFRLHDHCGGSGRSRIKPLLLYPPIKMKVSITINTYTNSSC